MSSSLNLRVSKAIGEIVRDYIMECGSLYNFNGEEAVSRLLSVELNKKGGKKNESKKLSWPMPFCKEYVNMNGCEGLKYNSGLFTQCTKNKEEGEYCKSCFEECSLNGRGIPENGCISERMKCGLMEFKDPKGRKPTSFLSILKKKNISVEKVREDAKEMNIIIDEVHFNEAVKEKKEKVVKEKVVKGDKKGRPKKAKKEVESSGVVDLFASLVEEEVVNEVLAVEEVIVEEKPKKDIITAEEKALKKAAKEASKSLAKAEKAAAEKAAREEKRAAEKAAKQAAKEAAKAEKTTKKKVKKTEVAAVSSEKVVEEVKTTPNATPKVTVTRFEHEGKKYLKSTENILYDADTKEELGVWCEESKTIKALPEDEDDEIEEEDYESEDE